MREVKREFQPADFIRTGIFVLAFLLVIVAYFVREGREISIIIPLAIIVGIIWTEMQRRDPRIYYDENNIIVTYRLFIFPMDTKKIVIREINKVSINEKLNSMGEMTRSLIFEIANEASPYRLDLGREKISDCRDFLLNIETQNPSVVDQDFLVEIQDRCADF
jgi:hypothetical protein